MCSASKHLSPALAFDAADTNGAATQGMKNKKKLQERAL